MEREIIEGNIDFRKGCSRVSFLHDDIIAKAIAREYAGDVLFLGDSSSWESDTYMIHSRANLIVILNDKAFSFVRLCSHCGKMIDKIYRTYSVGISNLADYGGLPECEKTVTFCSEKCENEYFLDLAKKNGYVYTGSNTCIDEDNCEEIRKKV